MRKKQMPIKSSIKIGALLGIIVSFSTYPMEDEFDCDPLRYVSVNGVLCDRDIPFISLSPVYMIQPDDIKQVNLYLDIKNLTILHGHRFHEATPLSDSHPLFTDENLPVALSIIQVFQKFDTEKHLQEIGNAVERGIRLTSQYHFTETPFKYKRSIRIEESGLPNNSVFEMIESWINKSWVGKRPPYAPQLFMAAKNSVMQTIFEAGDKRKTYINDELAKDIYDGLSIKVPQLIVNLIVAWLHDEENRRLIEQAKQESSS